MTDQLVQIKRFEVNASQEAKAEFARELVRALDNLEVDPGEEFVVTTALHVQHMEEEIKKAEEETAEWKVDQGDLEELVADYRRGILDLPELLDKLEDPSRR